MDYGLAPSLWLAIVAIGFAALGLGIAYGQWRRRVRDPAVEELREQATKELYRKEDARRDRSEAA
jgi:hypothetical protein